ncbi:MAG: biopolymer transporter ExbD [Dysgonamonadaceae bacterium]|jgi:biopolymer transport protein ExbD|nr:biopolymer transporter ExbD [Dysgonamonadaceae bacterium]
MAKAKVKKHSTFIDMTAMSDVTVLLLTFFMLTSTFVNKEPIQVTTPSSISETKVPDTNMLTILVDPSGKIFISMTNQDQLLATLKKVGEDYGITFTEKQLANFARLKSFGVPIRSMPNFLDLSVEKQDEVMAIINKPDATQEDLKAIGIPNEDKKGADGVIAETSEFKRWIRYATEDNKELQLAIKSDKNVEYPVVKKVIEDLRDLRKNRYLLLTSLKTASAN